MLDYLILAARLGFRGMFQLGYRFVGAIVELLRLRREHFAEAGKALRDEHERRVGLLAEATRIGRDRLRALAALHAPPVTRSIRGILASVLIDRLALGLLCSILLIVFGILALVHGRHMWFAPLSIAIAWALAHRALAATRDIDPADALVERAAHLARLFPVAFVVMGHTHVPAQAKVSESTTYINVGAWVSDGTMVDSHALIGSCAQIGARCHISAAAQIGGVLEPVGALPVVIEDDVMVGGNCGVYEGTVVKRRAVLGTGVILNRSTPVYDLVHGVVHAATADQPLIIPEEAVVVAGARAVTQGKGKEWGISLYTPVIVKYRDEKTDLKTQLEDLLR